MKSRRQYKKGETVYDTWRYVSEGEPSLEMQDGRQRSRRTALLECSRCSRTVTRRVDRLDRATCVCQKPGYRHGKTPKQVLQSRLKDIKKRCNMTSHRAYKDYGARGIYVCDEWTGRGGLANFVSWALANGYERYLQIDRIDNDGPYSPDNCRFVTPKQNTNNRRISN